MNRSSKGFGLAGVLATVVFLIVAAVMTSSANASVKENPPIEILTSSS